MNFASVFAIAAGATLGALLRWKTGAWLNGSLTLLPLGTLLVNLAGCFCIGATLVFRLPEFWKLLLVTGFLGGLTTFSTFAAELVTQMQQEKWHAAAVMLALHLGGGICAVLLGAACAKQIFKL